jgi:hypothetical protein
MQPPAIEKPAIIAARRFSIADFQLPNERHKLLSDLFNWQLPVGN